MERIEKIKELVRTLKGADYKDLFAALILHDKIEYIADIEDIDIQTVEYIDTKYNEFMGNDNITSLINEDIHSMFEGESDEGKI